LASQADLVFREHLSGIYRLALLENNPYYTKDAFVQKTAAWLKWKRGEEKRIHGMLKVRNVAPLHQTSLSS
jgi:hypothetical protein